MLAEQAFWEGILDLSYCARNLRHGMPASQHLFCFIHVPPRQIVGQFNHLPGFLLRAARPSLESYKVGVLASSLKSQLSSLCTTYSTYRKLAYIKGPWLACIPPYGCSIKPSKDVLML